MKVVVLAGGLSPERNVSRSTGAKVCQALRDLGHSAPLAYLFLDNTISPFYTYFRADN